MNIDSLSYRGACACGRAHHMQTEFCEISSGCLKNAAAYLEKYGIGGYTVAVYDENTYRATADRHLRACKEVILDPTELHANERGVAYLMENLPREAEVLIAVGAGTIHDLTRYCAYQRGIPFVSCPTAASVDGFCSSVAAMTWHGCKKTLTATAPRLVLADIDIIKNAPVRLTRSGIGDMLGKYIALTDWRVAHRLTGEFYCARIAELTEDATSAVLRSVQDIAQGSDAAYERLTYGLLLSGLAMQMLGSSRPASGAEHHISHLIETAPPALALASDALHGEKVGVATLMVLEEYKRLSATTPIFSDYAPQGEAIIRAVFGERLSEGILAENAEDCALGITGARIAEAWDDICRLIAPLPEPAELRRVYAAASIKSTLADIGLRAANAQELLRYSPLVRNRLTLMRLRPCLTQA